MSSDNFELKVRNLLKKLNIKNINNINTFMDALTHTTYSNEHKGVRSYQYLEFLGDTVIDFIVTKEIYKRFPDYSEGIATKHRSYIVSNKNLSKLSINLEISDNIRYSKNAFLNGKNPKIHSDFFESFVGALFIEKGLEYTEKFLLKHLSNYLKEMDNKNMSNPKSAFQELMQMHSNVNIIYKSIPYEKGGFISEVIVDKQKYGVGIGSTKKEAETNAAQNALDILISK